LPAAVLRRAPAAPEGLRIETRPPGASVSLDGRAAGETPLAIKDLRPGIHQLRLSLEGHAPAELTFEVPEGTSAVPLSFIMPPLLAPAEIHSNPEAATVMVDNRVIGLTPIQKLSLNAGPHEIRIERSGFLPAVKQVEARPGVKLLVQARLDPAPADLAPVPAASPVAPPLTEGMLVELDPSVKPPVHVSGDPAVYPKDARRLHLQGTVEVEMIVDERGVPHDVRLLHGASALLDEAVIEAVYKFRYHPATKDGVRVRARHTYSQTFP
jgi:TonB family protein